MTNAATGLPFDDIRNLLKDLPGPDEEAVAKARAREGQLTKPPGALGRLENLSEWLCAWQAHHPPKAERVVVAVFAGNHGVVAQNVAAYPQEVTKQMVANFQNDGAAVNQICKSFGFGLKVFELALEKPTRDITQDAALDEAECAATMAYGMEATEGCDLLCIGEMGIGNTTPAAAVAAALAGGEAAAWVGRGTGVDDQGLMRKRAAVQAAVRRIAGITDPIEVLREVGGSELVAIAAACVAARLRSIPVVLDGYVVTAAVLPLVRVETSALDHCTVGHCSAEPGHRLLLERLGKRPLLDLDMRLGEGSGAMAAVPLIAMACAGISEVPTFEEWFSP